LLGTANEVKQQGHFE
ncbi:hypothetical protein CICLE_v100269542mg, partial [Citrus x clementina]